MRKFKLLLVQNIMALVMLLLTSQVFAAAPRVISYPGTLTNTSNNTTVNTTVNIHFTFYDSLTAGNVLWTETQNVAVANGAFNVSLGAVTPLNLPFDSQYYLGIAVGSDPEMVPREVFAAIPYAFHADIAGNINLQCKNDGNVYSLTYDPSTNTWGCGTPSSTTNANYASSAGNASTVTNGVYTTGAYSNPPWLLQIPGNIVNGPVAQANAVINGLYSTGAYSNPPWLLQIPGAIVNGPVASAGKLATPVNINGTPFDGSANITVTDPTKLTWSGTYAAATPYVVNNLVAYNSALYIAIQAGTGNLPTNTTYWAQIPIAAGTGDLSSTASYSNPSWLTQIPGSIVNGPVASATYAATAGTATNANHATTADNVTNGIVTTGSYSNPSWLLQIPGSIVNGPVAQANAVTNGLYSTGAYSNPPWLLQVPGSIVNGQVPSAGTAGKLAASVNINNVPFDGSANITVTDPTKLTWSGTYDPAATYAVNNLVAYNSALYVAIQAGTGNLPTNTSYWAQIPIAGGDLSSTGSYSNPPWLTQIPGSIVNGPVANATNSTYATTAGAATTASSVTNGLYSTGSYADPTWLTSLSGAKITGTVANATNAVSATTATTATTAASAVTATSAGTATTAGKLTTPVTINGTSFDGSANITIPGVPFFEYYSGPSYASNASNVYIGGATQPTMNNGDVWFKTLAYTDIVGIFGGGSCVGYLKNDGTCGTTTGMVWPTGASGSIPNYNGASGYGPSYNASNQIPANYVANIAENQVTNLPADLANKAPLTGSQNITITSSTAGFILTAPNGSQYMLSVSNSGTLSANLVTADTTPPTVTGFSLGTVNNLTVPITTFSGTDNVAVAANGYCITEAATAAACSPSSCVWGANPAGGNYTSAGGAGTYYLCPYVQDTSGNVSTGSAYAVNATFTASEFAFSDIFAGSAGNINTSNWTMVAGTSMPQLTGSGSVNGNGTNDSWALYTAAPAPANQWAELDGITYSGTYINTLVGVFVRGSVSPLGGYCGYIFGNGSGVVNASIYRYGGTSPGSVYSGPTITPSNKYTKVKLDVQGTGTSTTLTLTGWNGSSWDTFYSGADTSGYAIASGQPGIRMLHQNGGGYPTAGPFSTGTP